jgi:hypothetical protein
MNKLTYIRLGNPTLGVSWSCTLAYLMFIAGNKTYDVSLVESLRSRDEWTESLDLGNWWDISVMLLFDDCYAENIVFM